jgi:hypothetical protein
MRTGSQPSEPLAGGRQADVAKPGDIDGGRPWSETELDDLERGLRLGVSLEVIAEFISRDVEEVQQKAEELGILPVRKRVPKDCSSARHDLQAPPKSAPSIASRPSDADR